MSQISMLTLVNKSQISPSHFIHYPDFIQLDSDGTIKGTPYKAYSAKDVQRLDDKYFILTQDALTIQPSNKIIPQLGSLGFHIYANNIILVTRDSVQIYTNLVKSTQINKPIQWFKSLKNILVVKSDSFLIYQLKNVNGVVKFKLLDTISTVGVEIFQVFSKCFVLEIGDESATIHKITVNGLVGCFTLQIKDVIGFNVVKNLLVLHTLRKSHIVNIYSEVIECDFICANSEYDGDFVVSQTALSTLQIDLTEYVKQAGDSLGLLKYLVYSNAPFDLTIQLVSRLGSTRQSLVICVIGPSKSGKSFIPCKELIKCTKTRSSLLLLVTILNESAVKIDDCVYEALYSTVNCNLAWQLIQSGFLVANARIARDMLERNGKIGILVCKQFKHHSLVVEWYVKQRAIHDALEYCETHNYAIDAFALLETVGRDSFGDLIEVLEDKGVLDERCEGFLEIWRQMGDVLEMQSVI